MVKIAHLFVSSLVSSAWARINNEPQTQYCKALIFAVHFILISETVFCAVEEFGKLQCPLSVI